MPANFQPTDCRGPYWSKLLSGCSLAPYLTTVPPAFPVRERQCQRLRMIELRVLGEIGLRVMHGGALHAVAAQPKRMALLVYLALASPRGFHRRDQLLALFWPEADGTRARGALRK